MTPSPESIQVNKIDDKLLIAPLSPSLLVPCRVAYPLRDIPPTGTLQGFYKTFTYNLGQIEKCYDKDEDLIEEIKERDNVDTEDR